MPRLSRSKSNAPAVGLDIQPGAVHAAEVRVTNGLVVERSATAALEPGVVRDGEVVDVEALTATLRQMFRESGLGKRVRIGLANQRVVVRHLLLPPIDDPKELATAVHFQAEGELPMPIDQAVLDHVVLGMVDTPAGPRQKVVVVAARRDLVDRLVGAVRAAGLRPVGVDLAAFGMLRALGGPPDEVVLHLSVGGLVNLAVSRGGECVFTRVIGGGLEPMAIELAERRGLTVEDAREILLRAGLPAQVEEPEPVFGPQLAPEVQAEDETITVARVLLAAGLRRIAAEVRNSIDFHLNADDPALGGTASPATVERVLLTGSALAVPGLADALGEQLGKVIVVSDVAGADPERPGSHAIAAGLAIEELAA